MNGSPWVNWQQFADLNAGETERAAEDKRQQYEQQKAQMQAAANKLASEAQAVGKAGAYTDITKLGSYTELMDAQKKAQAAEMGTPAGAAWEGYLQKPGQPTYTSPWADLEKHLGVARQAGQQGMTYQRTMRENQAREIEESKRRQQATADRLKAQRDALIKSRHKDVAGYLQDSERYEEQKKRYAGKL